MQRQDNAAIGGGLVGAAFAISRRHDRAIDRARTALNRAEDAQDTASEALTVANEIADGGDMMRLEAPAARDLLAGIDYPMQQPAATASAFATSPSIIARPIFSEDLAAAPTSWPGATNSYDSSGQIIQPSQALLGQNVATGMSLGFSEVRAALLGATLSSVPSEDILRQIFRFNQGIALEIQSLFNSGGAGALTQQQYRDAFRRYIAVTPAGTPTEQWNKLSFFAADTTTVTNTTTETEIARLAIPAGSITKVGDVLHLSFAVTAVGVNGADTLRIRVRLDSSSGTALFDSSAVNPTAGDSGTFNCTLTATTVGSSGVVALGGMSQLSGTVRGPANGSSTVSSFDTTTTRNLVITLTYSAASASNSAKGRWGQLLLQHTP